MEAFTLSEASPWTGETATVHPDILKAAGQPFTILEDDSAQNLETVLWSVAKMENHTRKLQTAAA